MYAASFTWLQYSSSSSLSALLNALNLTFAIDKFSHHKCFKFRGFSFLSYRQERRILRRLAEELATEAAYTIGSIHLFSTPSYVCIILFFLFNWYFILEILISLRKFNLMLWRKKKNQNYISSIIFWIIGLFWRKLYKVLNPDWFFSQFCYLAFYLI